MNILETYGIKELYDAQLRASYPITIGDKTIEVGEPIAIFKNIQIADFKEITRRVHATGGFDNRSYIEWSSTQGLTVKFTQGVFSQAHIAIASNSMLDMVENTEVMQTETHELEEDLRVDLRYKPLEGSIFIYDEEMNRINSYIIENEKELVFNNIEPYTTIIIYYDFIYSKKVTRLNIGRALITGYVEFCAKTKLRDDETGQEITALIKLPRVKLMSDLSIRLGKEAPAASISFEVFSYPTGVKGKETVMDLIFLDKNVDNDIISIS